jgi:response regulator RpfG family c-di-GMP phosphodiesterase
MQQPALPRTCPYYTETLARCGIRFAPTGKGKGMQAHVCLTEEHARCKFYKTRFKKKNVRLLVVDDHMDEHRDLLALLQKRAVCDVVLTPAKAVYAYMLSVKNRDYYDAVIVNAQISESDGIAAVREIRHFETGTLNLTVGIMVVLMCDEEPLMKSVRDELKMCCIKKNTDLAKVISAIEQDLVQSRT